MSDALRIGVAGLGTVGASVLRILRDKSEMLTRQCGKPVTVTAVSARDRNRDRGIDLSGIAWFDDPVELAKSAEIDLFIELIGGEDGPAKASVEAALRAGRHVVTANKALLARHGVALARIAEEKGVLLNFEAAVAGGIPVIKAMRESLTGNTVSRVYGIMNGTCNYILTRMWEEGISFESCLKDAQRLGYAEADPTSILKATTQRTSWRFSPVLPSARRSPPTISIWKVSAIFRWLTFVPLTNLATASSFLVLHRRPIPASNSAYIRPWCQPLRLLRRFMV